MKKTGKKLLALLLALMMLACAVPFSASAEQIEDNLFKDDGFYYQLESDVDTTIREYAIITGCDETVTGEIVVPSTIGGYDVYCAYPSAFCDRKDITKVTLSDGVLWKGTCTDAYRNDESNWDEDGVLYYQTCLLDAKGLSGEYKVKAGTVAIAEYAFHDCDNLTSLILPDSVVVINYCGIVAKNLEKLELGNGLRQVTGELSILSHKLKSLTFPESIESIGYGAIFCESLDNITLPDKKIVIAGNAFNATAYYKNEDNWENGVLYIGNHLVSTKHENFGESKYVVRDGTINIANYAFSDANNLETIEIPDSVVNIGSGCFLGCEFLKNVRLSNSLEDIKYETFMICYKLESIEIPGSVKGIESVAFANCTSLTSVKFLDGVSAIGYAAFYNCTALNEVIIPDSVKSIVFGAFVNCPNLKKVTIPAGVETIDEYAFGYYEKPEVEEDEPEFIKVDDFTIYGHKGTAAEKYAIENGFAFVDLDAKEEPVNPSEGCPCRCHKGGFENFIYKFLRIFWRLFRTHEFCECGVKHY